MLSDVGPPLPGLRTPGGVFARVVDGRTYYVNTTGQERSIPIDGSKNGILSNCACNQWKGYFWVRWKPI